MKNTPPFSPQPAAAGTGAPGDWLTSWRFAGIVALLILVCFPSVLLGMEAFVYGDMGQFAYPVAFFHRESFWRGEMPLWNPLNSCGIPFLAQWNTVSCYPGSLFYLLLPMPWSFDVFCLGHLILASVGMYVLAFRWTDHRFAAAVAGIAFGFNGLIWQSIMWPHFLAALAWMPWFIAAAEKAWREGGRAILWAALAGAMQMLSGGAEVIIQTWLVLGILWIVTFFRGEIPRRRLIGRTAMVGIWIVGLSAIQILPFLDLLAHSQRSSGYGSGEMGSIGAMPLSGFLNFFVPLFRCVRNPQGIFVQIGQEWVSSYYLAIGVALFAAIALWRVRTWRIWFLTGLTIFSLLLALGEPGQFYGLVKTALPFLGFVRFTVKFVAIAIFALPLMAAFGVNWLMAAPHEVQKRQWFTVKTVALGLLGLIFITWLMARIHPIAGSDISGNAVVRAIMLVLVVVTVGTLFFKTDLKLQRILQCAILAMLWFDVFTHTSNLSPTVPAAVLQPNAVRSFFNWDHELQAGTSRALESQDAFWKMSSTGSSDLVGDTYGRRRALSLNYNLLDGVPKFDGFYSMDLKEYLDVFKRVFFTTNAASGLKDFVGISHVSNPTNILDWVPRKSFLPLVTAGQKPMFVDDATALAGIFSNNFRPARTVFLPLEAARKISAGEQPNAQAKLTRFSNQRLDIETETAGPAILTIAQTFYHSWHAYVDGVPTQLWRANYAFQALEVPAGKHEVKVVYQDAAFICGTVISAVSAFIALGIWLWWKRKSQTGATQKI